MECDEKIIYLNAVCVTNKREKYFCQITFGVS